MRVIVYDIFLTFVCYGINVLWFVITLFWAKILFYLIQKIKLKDTVKLIATYAIGICAISFIEILSSLLDVFFLRTPILWMVIGIFRPLLAVPFIYLGFILYPVFRERVEKSNDAILKALVLSFLSLLILIPAFLRMKITMVNMVSQPAWMIMVCGSFGSMGVIGISYLIDRIEILKKIFVYFGKNSLTIMLTHEYLQIRSSVQSVFESIVENRVVALIFTFVIVILIETLICVLWNYYKKQIKLKRGI